MSRYIDADKLCEHLQNKLKTDYEMGLYNHGALTESFIRFVERQPTADVVGVVRCKDCFYAHFNTSSERYSCQREYPRRSVEEDDYCRYGKRSEENEG